MAMSAERAAAHERLEAAVEEMVRVYGTFDEGQFMLGYVLVVGGARMMSPDLDGEVFDPEDGDESEFVTTHRTFFRRGQQPVVSRGLMEFCLDSQTGRGVPRED